MDWVALILAAFLYWGQGETAVRVDANAGWLEPIVAYITHESGEECVIHVNAYPFNPPVDYGMLITHEVGHCIGMNHAPFGIMMPYYEDWSYSPYDRAVLWWRYPPANRVFLPMMVQ